MKDVPPLQRIIELKLEIPRHGLRIAVIPDTQIRPGVPLDHLTWCGKYLAHQQPDVIVQIGDFCDLSSLSTHDEKGSITLEGKRYKKDLDAVYQGLSLLICELSKVRGWKPKLVMTLGNHEDRITRTIKADPKLEGVISLNDLGYKACGWDVYPFLQPVTIGGVAFCHYFPSGIMGRPITSARTILSKLHMSAYAGHQQGRDIAYAHRADGRDLTAIISGSFYQHEEEYLSPFTNNHWRGMYMLNEVRDGQFDEMAVSIDYLRRRFK
jgi:hypothetical protein